MIIEILASVSFITYPTLLYIYVVNRTIRLFPSFLIPRVVNAQFFFLSSRPKMDALGRPEPWENGQKCL